MPPMEIVFFRCTVSMIICLAMLWRSRTDWKGSNRTLLFARGFFGTLSLYTFFITLQHLPLGTAVTIQYLSPIFTTIIAIYLLGERVRMPQWLFFSLSFAGVMVIKGVDSRVSFMMLGIGVLSALSSGFAYNVVRSLKEKEPTMVVVLHFQLFGVIAGLLGSFFEWQTPVGIEWLYLILIGICTQSGQVYLTKALKLEKIADVTILNYLGILYALFFGWTFFGEHYDWLSLSGIILVLGGILLNFIYQRRRLRLLAEKVN